MVYLTVQQAVIKLVPKILVSAADTVIQVQLTHFRWINTQKFET